MEKDNFENYLKRIVIQSDQHTSRNSNKERVWNKINEDRKSQGVLYWVVAASFAILVLVFLPDQMGNVKTDNGKIAKIKAPFKNDIETKSKLANKVASNVKSLKPRNKIKPSKEQKELHTDLIASIYSNSEKDLLEVTKANGDNTTKEPLKLPEIISVDFRPGELIVSDDDLVSIANQPQTTINLKADTLEDSRIVQSPRKRLKLSFKKQL